MFSSYLIHDSPMKTQTSQPPFATLNNVSSWQILFHSSKTRLSTFHTIIFMQNTCLVHNSKDEKKSSTLAVEAKPFIMQTHFKMSCGSLMGGLRILQGAVRERNVGFKREDKSMAALEELEMVTERGM